MLTPLFAELGALKVDDLYTQTVRLFAFKAAKGTLPGGMAGMIDKVGHGYNTRGARSNFFIDRSDSISIKSIAPRVWNSFTMPRHCLKVNKFFFHGRMIICCHVYVSLPKNNSRPGAQVSRTSGTPWWKKRQ